MFDLGMWELMLVGIVALLVLGPDKLPKAARTAGYWVRRARQSWYAVRNEIERELAADEFKRSIRDSREALSDSARQVRDSGHRIQRSITGHVTGQQDQQDDAGEPPALDSKADASGDRRESSDNDNDNGKTTP